MSHPRSALAGFVVVAVLLPAARLGTAPASSPHAAARPLVAAAFVSAGGSRFTAPGPGGAQIGVAPDHLAVRDGRRFGRLTLIGAARGARPAPEGRLPGVVNDYRNAARRTGLHRYERIRYRDVWQGIDVVYRGLGDGLEYDFALAPGADPARIALRRSGALPQRAPRAFQDGREIPVSLRDRDGVLGFEVGAYDRSRPLLIDPSVVFATLLGGSGADGVISATTDASGNIIVAGLASSGFPSATGYGGNPSDGFVSKLTGAGRLVWSTYLGGSGADEAFRVAMAPDGGIVVGSNTSSPNFPTTAGVLQTTAGGGFSPFRDTAVTKLTPEGTVTWSSYLSGSNDDTMGGLAVDPSGAVIVSGTTASADFPTTPGGFSTTYAHGNDGFVAKLNASGSGLVWSGYLGSPNGEEAMTGAALASNGAVWVSGGTGAPDYPTTTQGGEQTALGGATDAVLTRIAADGSSIEFSTYFGGDGIDLADQVVLDGGGNVVIAGLASGTIPTLRAAQPTYGGGVYDGFVAKYSPAGAPQWSTYIGGNNDDTIGFVAADAAGTVYVSGVTQSTNLPVTEGSQPESGDGALAIFAPDGALRRLLAVPIGGSAKGVLVTTIGAGSILLYGETSTTRFSATAGAVKTSRSGSSDGFLLRLDPAPRVTAPATDFGRAGVGTDVDRTVTVTNAGDASLTVSAAAIGGATASDYAITANGCKTVAPGASCPIAVRFTPAAEGARAATLDLTTNEPAGASHVALTGTGLPYVAPLPLSCERLSLTILDVHQEGGRIRVQGVALVSLAGQQVTIRPSRGRGSAKARIQAGGSFAATLPVPKRRDVEKVSYTATVGGKKSPPLRLDRPFVITRSRGLKVTARLRGGRRGQKVALRRQVSCTRTTPVRTLTLGKGGVLKLTLPRPAAGSGFVLYRLVARAATLPIAVRG